MNVKLVFSERSQCRHKRKYPRRRDALRKLRELQTLGKGRDLTIYRCPYCDSHHLGKDFNRRGRAA